MFSLQGFEQAILEWEGVETEFLPVEMGYSKFDLTLTVRDDGAGFDRAAARPARRRGALLMGERLSDVLNRTAPRLMDKRTGDVLIWILLLSAPFWLPAALGPRLRFGLTTIFPLADPEPRAAWATDISRQITSWGTSCTCRRMI